MTNLPEELSLDRRQSFKDRVFGPYYGRVIETTYLGRIPEEESLLAWVYVRTLGSREIEEAPTKLVGFLRSIFNRR